MVGNSSTESSPAPISAAPSAAVTRPRSSRAADRRNYVDDPPHEILCHGVNEFGGDWLVVRASGEPAP